MIRPPTCDDANRPGAGVSSRSRFARPGSARPSDRNRALHTRRTFAQPNEPPARTRTALPATRRATTSTRRPGGNGPPRGRESTAALSGCLRTTATRVPRLYNHRATGTAPAPNRDSCERESGQRRRPGEALRATRPTTRRRSTTVGASSARTLHRRQPAPTAQRAFPSPNRRPATSPVVELFVERIFPSQLDPSRPKRLKSCFRHSMPTAA